MIRPRVIDRAWTHIPRRRSEHGITEVLGVIVHAMGERIIVQRDPIDAWEFLDESPDLIGELLSVHAICHPDGTLTVCADDGAKCNHAGVSHLADMSDLNWTFLGIEFLLQGAWAYRDFRKAMDTGAVRYTDAQYEAGGWWIATKMRQYGFGRGRVARHSQVSGDDIRGRGLGKRDPGVGFNDGRLTVAIDRWLEAIEADEYEP